MILVSNCLNRFQFYNYFAIAYEVHTETLPKFLTLVQNMHSLFPLIRYFPQFEFILQCILINWFSKTTSQFTVYLHRSTNNLIRFFLVNNSFFHSLIRLIRKKF